MQSGLRAARATRFEPCVPRGPTGTRRAACLESRDLSPGIAVPSEGGRLGTRRAPSSREDGAGTATIGRLSVLRGCGGDRSAEGGQMLLAVAEREFELAGQQEVPMQRLGSPEEVAEVVSFLCGERSSYVNGAEIHINGGQHL